MSIHNILSKITNMYIPNYITPQPLMEKKSILTTIHNKNNSEPISIKRTNTLTCNEWKTIIGQKTGKQYTVKNET